ncbi:AAA family ATPase [Arcicella sp. LKC2W]|uniref:ATP-dependent nuclease n=1 Tax=Arcicella sp. LKC2W TaxID=2984198 RepID=UPI002B210DD0|nr:AAA family ATPase [Arcicella sp. LKC2W]MEA5457871.1 AAA family ATPase [Arcicella sp. LKC2W]
MKISKIHIKDFHQFKDFTLDLTYPQGHEKVGQPLDKVCFIGQSGTGKTSLLELIPPLLFDYDTNIIEKSGSAVGTSNIQATYHFGENYDYFYESYLEYELDRDGQSYVLAYDVFDENDFETNEITQNVYQDWTGKRSKLIYFPANLNFNIDLDENYDFNKKNIVDFSEDKVSTVWNLILEKIQNYQEQELKIRQDISKVVEKSSSDIEAIQKAVKQLEDWKNSEFNPIKDVADNCLDPLLAKFKLRVKTELDFKTKDDIGFIKVEDFEGNEIPHGLWSTGTKQVILSALPLYLLKPKHTVILFDEPERSLYPDLQRTVVNYYSSLAESCQFFYSTHSPIIASSFDPWEIVELKFNKEGKVYRETYFEGENHVDNYKWNPKYMRWDDILQRVFDLEDDGSPDRKVKLDELATLNVKFKKLKTKEQEHSVEALEIVKNIEKLSKELSKWN